MRAIDPALYTGNTTAVGRKSSERIKKNDENILGIPTHMPVKISFLVGTFPCLKVMVKLTKKATENTINKK